MDLKIEKNIPIPKTTCNSKTSEMLKQMEIGDSITCNKKRLNSIKSSAYYHGILFVTRKIKDNLYRFWKIK